MWLGDRFEGSAVSMEVSDDGPGIRQDLLRKIFEPFYTTRKAGHGMGLAAVLGIVRAHGGCISVYSVEGEGTTFKVLLPAKDDLPDQADAHPAGAEARRTAILVIDDEDSVRKFVGRCLERGGFEVELAGDPRVGIDAFRALHSEIDLVLLDLSMPHLNGRDAYRELQRIDPNVPVIIMSGFSEQEIALRFAGRPISVLQKPFTADLLLGAVRAALKAHQPG